jgi:hypothetical protein
VGLLGDDSLGLELEAQGELLRCRGAEGGGEQLVADEPEPPALPVSFAGCADGRARPSRTTRPRVSGPAHRVEAGHPRGQARSRRRADGFASSRNAVLRHGFRNFDNYRLRAGGAPDIERLAIIERLALVLRN